MQIRPSSLILILLTGLTIIALSLVIFPQVLQQNSTQSRLIHSQELVLRLGLTDLALMTESRYTRHPSQADLHSAFQDHPAAFDHFPSGSLITPPKHTTHLFISSDDSHVAGKTTSSD